MNRRNNSLRRSSLFVVATAIAAACTPIFAIGTSVQTQGVGGSSVRLIWNTAFDGEFPAAGHSIANYEVRVNGALVASPSSTVAACRLNGLGSNTVYDIEVSARSTSDEDSRDIPPLGILSDTYTTPPGGATEGTITCVAEADNDGDRLPNWVETNTGVYVDSRNTGTDPNVPDTDGDGIDDGEETVGTINGLHLNQMGANPLRASLFLEVDWMDDSLDCGPHSHRPSAAAVNRLIAAFATAPIANPDGSTGIDMIVDYGQGDTHFYGGNLVVDDTPPFGAIDGGVNDSQYQEIKAANFSPLREGYFHYALHLHNYDTDSTSSGQAELPGDDQIVSLQCFDSTNNTSNTMMHELGHNLGLRHGGNENENWKPNYNSVMNYRYQFPGADDDCDAVGDQVLDYSSGTNLALNENNVVEAFGVCGGPAIDWNGNTTIDPAPYTQNLNPQYPPISFGILNDFDDWANISFSSVNDADGARVAAPTLVSEAPIPTEYQTSNGD